MANVTDPLARSVHGTNPQNLIEYITRQKIYDSLYWKEECFGLSASDVVSKASELKALGGSYGGNNRPTRFLCLALKLLQIQPEDGIVESLIENEDFKYVRALGAFYLRLTGRPAEIYELIEPLANDFRKLRYRESTGWRMTHVDELADGLLNSDRYCGIALPHLPNRDVLVNAGYLDGPRVSALTPLIEEKAGGDAEAFLRILAEAEGGGNAAAKAAMDDRRRRRRREEEEEEEEEEGGGGKKEEGEEGGRPNSSSRGGRMTTPDDGDVDVDVDVGRDRSDDGNDSRGSRPRRGGGGDHRDDERYGDGGHRRDYGDDDGRRRRRRDDDEHHQRRSSRDRVRRDGHSCDDHHGGSRRRRRPRGGDDGEEEEQRRKKEKKSSKGGGGEKKNKYGSLFKRSTSDNGGDTSARDGKSEGSSAAAGGRSSKNDANEFEGRSDDYWNEQRAKLGLKPLKD